MYDKLYNLCQERLNTLPVCTEKHTTRLALELKEINATNESEYFLSLFEKGEKLENENNLLVPYLLGICDVVDIDKEPKYVYGEFPDIDIDYVPEVRTYLKEKYAREAFGEDFVCNIATYTTFGLRSVLIDMAKVFDLDRNEILALTTKLKIKDNEGEILTWDKALEIYDDLKEYIQRHPEMADAAKRLLHRNRNMGMHASGLIISGVPIKNFVPLVRVKENSNTCSAWVEGLHGTDLGAVGLVKFDFLSLDGNSKIATATHLIEEMTKEKSEQITESACAMIGKVKALPGKSNWTDTSYLDDPEALAMANKGDLKMIFQYDGSEGIRKLARQGGITTFDDLVAYTAIFRPGPMKGGVHTMYCSRKNKKEEYTIHPLLEPILNSTYGTMVYQEQIMKILHVVGNIPLKDCEQVRKAISKKKVEKFKEYKEMFVLNGQRNLGCEAKVLEDLWKQIEFFAGYGFNLAHSVCYGYITARMLYLKCHYPLAFYSSVLSHTNAACPKDYQKLKDYKSETERHGIRVNKAHINKSGFDCNVVDGEIYYGFSKIKNIGEDAARKIVALQPYKDYEDFLHRYGTDAKVNQAVLALRMFEGDPLTLYQFYEEYKFADRKRVERTKRFDKSLLKFRGRLAAVAGTDELDSAMYDAMPEETKTKAYAIIKLMTRSIEAFERKAEEIPTMANFVPEEIPNNEFTKLLLSEIAAEEAYYGFIWHHPIEKCKNYNGYTFESFEGNEVGPIDIQVKKIQQKKGPKATYYSMEVEDASCETKRITIWGDDYKRFEDVFVKGKFLRLRVKAPDEGFSTFMLEPFANRFKKPKKEDDARVFPLD
jgi:hypothetical protein